MRKAMPHKQATDDRPPRPITFRAAEKLGAFELAQLWSDPSGWRIHERAVRDELAELAVMSALAEWLHRWQPMAIHGAMLAGARPEAVASALGGGIQDVYERWSEWALAQRDVVYEGGELGISPEDYDAVARRFAAVGVKL